MSASPAPVYDWNALDAAARDAVLARPVQAVAQRTRDAVAGLLADVQARGDVALREVTARFDGVELAAFEVGEEEFAAAHTARRCRRRRNGSRPSTVPAWRSHMPWKPPPAWSASA